MEITENMVNQPGKEILFAHLASNLLKSGELDKAIKLCEKGLKKFPTYAQAHYVLARCYIRKKLNDEARAELERVLRYDPGHIKAIRDIAGLYFANGFQDLYKEYLMQLFTLDPINENVIQEAKKLGEYELWLAVKKGPVSPEPAKEIDLENEDKDQKDNVFIEPEKENASLYEPDPIFPDKIDLSQFDNVKDDFTTILHGKLEYSGKIAQSEPDKDPELEDIAKDIIEEPVIKDKAASSPDKDQVQPSMDEPQGADGKLSDKGLDDSMGSANQEPPAERITYSDEYPDEEEEKFEQPKIISQTLGEILVSQQKYVEAKAVFEALKEKQPDNKALDLKIEYLDRIIGLEKKGKS
ncbi:MAG: tetratricopeptide repeat protein [Calditrichia bacterium]|nr:tetratricopeptide repeat protein [Calditrichia bacterium]